MDRYSFGDLLVRYGMSKSALSKYIANHLNDIGEGHAVKTSKGWVFDLTAVNTLDRLRNIGMSSTIPINGVSNQEIQDYKDTIANLQQLLLASQKETADARAETISVMKECQKLQKQLSLVSVQYAQLAEGKSTVNELESIREQIKQGFDDIIENQPSAVNSGKGWNRRGTVRLIKLIGK